MAQALAKSNGQLSPAGLGERENVREVFERIRDMMPGAAKAPDSVVLAAAQIATAHRLNPFNGDIYIMSTGKRKNPKTNAWEDAWVTHVGVKGLRKSARRQAEYMTEFEDMTADEVKAARRAEYHPEDVGVRCILYRLDVAQKCFRISIPYIPVKAVGFWRKVASLKDEWKNDRKTGRKIEKPDNIPVTWTPQMVAKKRAEINAIKEAFDLEIGVADPAQTGDEEMWEVMEKQIADHDRDRALPTERLGYERDDDGEMWAQDKTPPKTDYNRDESLNEEGEVVFSYPDGRQFVEGAPEEEVAAPSLSAAYRDGIDPKAVLMSGEDFIFQGMEDALNFAAAATVFDGEAAAQNAYAQVKEDGQPASANEMWGLWLDHLAMFLNGKEEDEQTWA